MVVFISLNGDTPGEFMMLTITDVTNMLHKVTYAIDILYFTIQLRF